MADLTSVGVTSGVPSSGTGTVATINYLTQVGAPISNGSTSAPVTVAITGNASAVTSSMNALVVVLSPNSSVRTTTLSSNPTVIPSSVATVTLSSNPTITSLTSGTVASRGSYGAPQLTQASVSVSGSSNNTLVTRSVGTIKVYGMMLVPDAPVTMTFFNGSSASVLSGAMNLGSLFLPIQTEPYFTTTGTNNFVLNLSSSGQVSGMIYYLDN
jgi:hypothetical protein